MWTTALTESVAKRFADGETAASIASDIGTTRSAVLGKMHRIRVRGVNSTPHKKVRVSIPKPKLKTPAPKLQPLTLANGEPVQLLDLEPHMCKWPYGDPLKDDFHFCGHSAVDGKAYCAAHCKEAYIKVSRSAPKTHWNLPGMHK